MPREAPVIITVLFLSMAVFHLQHPFRQRMTGHAIRRWYGPAYWGQQQSQDRYKGIADTIVQLFLPRRAALMTVSEITSNPGGTDSQDEMVSKAGAAVINC